VATVFVANTEQLVSALSTVSGGDTILLAPGDYGTISVKYKNYSSPVTIASADPSNQATFSALKLYGVSGLNFSSIEVDFVRGDLGHSAPAISVQKSSHVSFDGMYVHGTLDGDAANDGYGITVTGSSHISVTNSEFEQLYRGAVFNKSTDLTLSGNSFHHLRSDGSDFAQVQRVVIDGNQYRDIFPVGADHPDAIQFFTNGTTAASTDIRITNNVIIQGDGGGMQGIFLRDETDVLPYQNVYIGNNFVYIPSYHNGISVLGGNTVEIVDNTVLSPLDSIKSRIWFNDVTNGHAEGNITETILQTGVTSVTLGSNVTLMDQPDAWRMLPNPSAGSLAPLHDLRVDAYGYRPSTHEVPAAPTAISDESSAGSPGDVDYVIEQP